MKHPVPTQEELTGIAIAYKNKRLIADEVLPRVSVGKTTYKYLEFDTERMEMTIVNTRVGRKGVPGEVEFFGTEHGGVTSDYGLDGFVPVDDVKEAPKGYDPISKSVTGIMSMVHLNREKRVADKVFDASNYGSNTTAVAAADRFDVDTSSPLDMLQDTIESMWLPPRKMVLNSLSLSKLRRNPAVVRTYNGSTAGEDGMVPLSWLEDQLSLKIIAGDARANTAQMGQTPSLTRLWGNHLSLIYEADSVEVKGDITFGWTAVCGSPVAWTEFNKKRGLRGGYETRAGETMEERIVCTDAGWLLTNVIG